MYEGALRFLDQASNGLREGSEARFQERCLRAQAVLSELRLALDHEQAPELAQQLEALYHFAEGQIRKAIQDGDDEALADARDVLETLLDGLEAPGGAALSSATLSRDLDDLKGSLEQLLSCYESEQFPEVAVVEAAWTRVNRAFEGVRAELEALPAGRDRVQERIDDCLRLYAVASGLLVRRREEMVAARATCVEARRQLQRNRPDRSGGSCDVRA